MTDSQFNLFDSLQSETKLIAGVDEVGRGPLAGPVVAAAVILDPDNPIVGLKDSKKLTHAKRLLLRDEIKEKAIAWSTAWCTVEEIDEINILQASLVAMTRAVERLMPAAEFAQIDGNKLPKLSIPAEAIVKGDSKVAAISAASILAKVERDLEMERLDEIYPGYGLAVHKGYPTAQHLSALKSQGVTEIHRRSYKPVRELLDTR
ncbi:ribonuclease HII [Hahella ganghwensis]|uniref:ribonuclease HII n=1 Tax=Hahella ganghwensis TaxID=286420 RepID=UPI000374CA9C|nr:ribonuclease HII [Hahella ganghwensis]